MNLAEKAQQQIATERAAIRTRVQSDVDKQFEEIRVRQQADTERRNQIVADGRARREREAREAREREAAARLAATEPDTVAGNTQGDIVAIATPAKPAVKTGRKLSTRDKSVAKLGSDALAKTIARNNAAAVARSANGVKGSGATKPAGKPGPKPAQPSDGRPSLPDNKQVFVRHMRNPRDAYILIKNTSVFTSMANWATTDEFKSKEDAVAWAEKHGLKVMNK